MKHISSDKTRTELTDKDWLPIGASIANLANKWSARTDIVAFVGEGATAGLAPALFKPAISEMELDVELAFGFGVKPEHIGDIETISSQYEFPIATGAVIHEAMHARFSRWDIEVAGQELEPLVYEALLLLEEGRIEKLGVELDKRFRVFLRSSAMKLVIGDVELEKMSDLTIAGATKLLALVEGRVQAGVLDTDEMAEIMSIVKSTIADETAYNRLIEIMQEFQKHTNHWDIKDKYPLAKEWVEIISNLQKERGEEPETGEGKISVSISVSSGESESGEGEGDKEKSEALQELLDKLAEAVDEVSINTITDLYDQQEADEWEQEVKESKSKQREKYEHKEASEEVFSKDTGETHIGGTYSSIKEKRVPTSQEHKASVIVARMLEQAKYRERDLTITKSELPQGKLLTRAVMQNKASVAQGMLPTAKEWKRKVRKQTDEPTLNVGVMVDISGSMRPAMEAMATTAWVMSEAVRRVQGRASMVYYGQDVFPTLKAGQHLDGVSVYTATDPTEKFDKAFKALDGSLNLLYGSGARLLVVVSDGVYTGEESKKARQWVQRCEQNGVGVLWLTFTEPRNSEAEKICKGLNAVVLSGTLNPAEVAIEIGKASAKALEMTNKTIA